MTTINRPVLGDVRSVAVDVAIVAAGFVFLAVMFLTGHPGRLGELIQGELRSSFGFFVSVQFLLAVPVIFLIEHLLPARPEQRGFSASVLFDALYMLLHLPVVVGLMVWITGPVRDLLAEHASWAVVDSTRSWPLWLMALVGIAIKDFFVWLIHLVKHRVPLFWRFHMVHHSQQRMSMFTSNRTHPIDAAIDGLLLLVPFFFLFPSFLAEARSVFLLAIIPAWTERFQHANIRTNLGPLRYVFVTPQSHRIHHSTEPEHWNSNYGALFAWDRVFGTQHPDVTSYPTTGINDPHFPEPERASAFEFASSFVGQLLFPFDGAAVRRASEASPHEPAAAGDRSAHS